MNGKIAALEVRNSALLRNKVPNLVVPLACIVDYCGLRYMCLSLLPLSTNSLAYGSDDEGLTFKNNDKDAFLAA